MSQNQSNHSCVIAKPILTDVVYEAKTQLFKVSQSDMAQLTVYMEALQQCHASSP